jgi:hypothetical protein
MADQSNTIAQLLTQSQGGVFDPAQLQQSVKLGMDLATAKDKIESQKIELQQQKDAVEQKKFDMVHNSINTLVKASPAVSKRLLPQMYKRLDAAGIAYDPIVFEELVSDDMTRNKLKQIAPLLSAMGDDPEQRVNALMSIANYTDFGPAIDKALELNKQQMAAKSAERVAAKTAKTQERQGRSEAMSLRKEYQSRPEVKNFVTVSEAFNKVKNAAKSKTAAGDMSLIFGYMKMLDPGSTVREGEFATAQNAAGIPDRVLNLYNKAIDGEFLSDRQRGQFVNEAGGVFNAQKSLKDQVDSEYTIMAGQYGADPKMVVAGVSGKETSQQAPDAQKQAAEAVIKSSKYPPEKIAEMMAAKGLNYTVEQINAIRGK